MAKRPKVLDLFCGAGGAGEGYRRAGFDVFGVDVQERLSYPFDRAVGDALEYAELHGFRFDLIHASPPCQRYSVATRQHVGAVDSHPDLIAKTRDLLRAIGAPYVIENVETAPLLDPIRLCGSSFGLGTARHYLRRHRLFEFGPYEFDAPALWPPCVHPANKPALSIAGNAGGTSTRDGAERFGSTAEWREAMDVSWMTGRELREAIPPAYTEWIGRWFLEAYGI